MFESENTARSSVEGEGHTDSSSVRPTPSEVDREDPPSLQMLEESAAQLAALRQRAEFLLDQLSNDRVDGSAPAAADGRDVIPPPTTDDHDGGGAAIDESAQTRFEERLFPLPLENDIKPAGAHDAVSTDQQAPDQHSETPGSNLPAAHADGSTPDIPSSGPSFASHSPQGTGLLLSEFSGRSSAGKTNNNRSSIDSPLDETAQSSAYPIQRHHSQPTSILDRPIGATQPPFSRVAETRFDVTATDVQVVEDEIVSLYKAINRVKQSPRENTGHALSLLREAREIMLADPQRIERVEYNIQQARQILDRARASRRHSWLLALRTVSRLVLWLAVLGGLGAALYFYPQSVDEIVAIAAARVGWRTSLLFPALWAVVAGGAGGCLGTISFLVERMRVQHEFDDKYILRSTVQPLMGVVLGLLTFGLLALVFSSLGTSITVHPAITYLPAAIALPIGLWQEYVYALIFRLTRLLTFQRRRRW